MWSEPLVCDEISIHDTVMTMGALEQPIDALLTPDQVDGYTRWQARRAFDDLSDLLGS